MDDEARKVVVAYNAAENGRMFCALLVLINLAISQPRGAVIAALGVGFAYVADKASGLRARAFAAGCALGAPITALLIAIATIALNAR